MHPTQLTKNSYKLLIGGIQANPWGRSCHSSSELRLTGSLLEIGPFLSYRFDLLHGFTNSDTSSLLTSMLTVPSSTVSISSMFALIKTWFYWLEHTLTPPSVPLRYYHSQTFLAMYTECWSTYRGHSASPWHQECWVPGTSSSSRGSVH